MRSFQIDVIFVKILFKSEFKRCFDNISLIYKTESLLQLNNKVLFSPASYTKMFGRDEHLIQFFLSLYPMLFSHKLPLICIYYTYSSTSLFLWISKISFQVSWKSDKFSRFIKKFRKSAKLFRCWGIFSEILLV